MTVLLVLQSTVGNQSHSLLLDKKLPVSSHIVGPDVLRNTQARAYRCRIRKSSSGAIPASSSCRTHPSWMSQLKASDWTVPFVSSSCDPGGRVARTRFSKAGNRASKDNVGLADGVMVGASVVTSLSRDKTIPRAIATAVEATTAMMIMRQTPARRRFFSDRSSTTTDACTEVGWNRPSRRVVGSSSATAAAIGVSVRLLCPDDSSSLLLSSLVRRVRYRSRSADM